MKFLRWKLVQGEQKVDIKRKTLKHGRQIWRFQNPSHRSSTKGVKMYVKHEIITEIRRKTQLYSAEECLPLE